MTILFEKKTCRVFPVLYFACEAVSKNDEYVNTDKLHVTEEYIESCDSVLFRRISNKNIIEEQPILDPGFYRVVELKKSRIILQKIEEDLAYINSDYLLSYFEKPEKVIQVNLTKNSGRVLSVSDVVLSIILRNTPENVCMCSYCFDGGFADIAEVFSKCSFSDAKEGPILISDEDNKTLQVTMPIVVEEPKSFEEKGKIFA